MISKNTQIAWLETKKINSSKEDLKIIDFLIRTVKNPSSFPIPENIEKWEAFIAVYTEFIKRETGAKATITPTAGKKLKEIIYFLLAQDKVHSEEDALSAFKYILHNWRNISIFLQSQVSLPQIEKNKYEILRQIKNGHSKTQAQKSADTREELKRMFKGG